MLNEQSSAWLMIYQTGWFLANAFSFTFYSFEGWLSLKQPLKEYSGFKTSYAKLTVDLEA